MSATIIDLRNTSIHFPDFIILDASIVLELWPNLPGQYHSIVVDFFRRIQPLVDQGQVIPLLPLLAFEECCFKLCRIGIESHLSNIQQSNIFWHNYYKTNPGILNGLETQIRSFYQILQAFPIVIIEPEDLAVNPIETEPRLADRMIDMMLGFQVLPKDATILSNAERLGIDTVVTLDSDWRRADGFTVITVIESQL